jgi:hypothetical protein
VVADAGGRVIGELTHYLSSVPNSRSPSDIDPLDSLAKHYHDLPYGPRHFVDRGALLKAQTQHLKPSAAIVWAAEEDESVAWQLPHLMKSLEELSIPALRLARMRSTDGGEQSVRQFVESLTA